MSVYFHHGSWWIDVTVKGKRIARQGGFPTELDAKVAEREAKESAATINTDFLKLCESRLEDLELKRTPQHFKENKSIITQWIKRWGNKRITRDDIETYLNETARESKSKANKHLRLLRALFNHGVNKGWIKDNPTRGITRFPESKKAAYIPSQADIEKVIRAAKQEERLYLLVVAHTLGRVRSVNRLKWDDVHDNYVSLYTRKARNSDLKEIRVPMNAVLREVLSLIPRESEYVFFNKRTGKPFDYRDKFLPSLCKKVGVRPFMYHALRHFGASKLDNAGAPITDIQQLLGHERATTTDHYLQSLRGSATQSIRLLEDLTGENENDMP